MTAGSPIRLTAMYRWQLARGARFREAAAWRVADVFTSAEDEAARARAGVGLSDVSPATKLGVRGEDAAALIEKATGQPAPPPGAAVRARANGADLLVCRLAPDEALVLAAPARQEAVRETLARTGEAVACAHVTDLTSAFAAVDLVGPRTPALLEKLVPLDLSPAAVAPLAVVQGELARVRAILIRLDHPSLAAVRVLVPRELGAFVWEALWEAGHDVGVVPVGAAGYTLLLGTWGGPTVRAKGATPPSDSPGPPTPPNPRQRPGTPGALLDPSFSDPHPGGL